MQKLKIGLVGNGCTGKTTSMFALFSELKCKKYNVGYVSDMARGVSFNPSKFDVHPEARLHTLFKQISEECAHVVRDDIEILLCERTALDWYLYYLWTCNHVGVEPGAWVGDAAANWMTTYDMVLVFDDTGFEYVRDGFRPESGKLRQEMSGYYHAAIETMFKDEKFNNLQVIVGDMENRIQTTKGTVLQWLERKS